MSKCSAKECVNTTRNARLVQYTECNHCPNWEATAEERSTADELELFRRLNTD